MNRTGPTREKSMIFFPASVGRREVFKGKGITAFYRRNVSYRTTKNGGMFLDAAGFITGLLIVSLGIVLSYILERRQILGKKQES